MLKIFLLSADPRHNSKLNVDVEFNQIDKEVLPKSTYRDEFSVEKTTAANYDNLLEILMRDETSIIHFSGHGVGEEGLVLVDEKGKKNLLKTKTLTQLINVLQRKNQHIHCLILNGCYTEIQAKAISPYVKYVIGMSDEVYDEDAVKFAKYFYKALFEKKDIETSFELACISIGHSILMVEDENSKRAIYDPAPDDEKASQPIPNYKIPQLIVNKELKDVSLEMISEVKEIISYRQWGKLESILLKIDFDILKCICRDTLKQDIKDIEREFLPIKSLVDVKNLLLKKYPIHKDNDTLTILEFAERLTKETDISDNQKDEIKQWLKQIAQEKNIDLPILPEETEPTVSPLDKTLNSYLLISIIENPEGSGDFSLEAELIPNYQEGSQDYEPMTITSEQEGINEISPEQIESYISDLIYRAIQELPRNHNLTIELFLPFDYLGKTFELCKIPKRRKGFKCLGCQYRFTVRCLDRYEDKSLFNQHWIMWKGIQAFLDREKGQEFLEKKCDYLKLVNQTHNWDKLSTKWQRNHYFSINIIDKLPLDEEQQEEYFDNFLESGVPLSLWSRHPEVLCDIDDHERTVEEKCKEILNIESLKNLTDIFERIRQLREDAHNEGDKAKKYLGYHLGFIGDRPDLIPSNLLKRLNKNGLKGSN